MIKIYRKGGRKPAKMTKAQQSRFAQHMQLMVRVQRPEIEELFVSGQFYALPAVPQNVIKNRGLRIMDHADDGWIVPENDYVVTRNGEQSAANSIKLWIEKNLVPFGLTRVEDFAVVVED